jgi:hypothetical protein
LSDTKIDEAGDFKKEYMQKFKANSSVFIIFGVFVIYLIVQHTFVFMYFDDFGYAALTYGEGRTFWGEAFSLSRSINYFIWHYNNWGGRVLFLGLYSVLLQSGLYWIRLFQVLMITVISASTYFLVGKYSKESKAYTAILSCALYGVIQIGIAQHGLYWFAASSCYLWPIAPFLFGSILLLSHRKHYVLISILFFVAGFSQEQIGASVVFFVLFYILVDYIIKNDPFNKKNIIALISSWIGALILYIAPGNKVRMNDLYTNSFYNRDFLERSISNAKIIVKIIFNNTNMIWIVLLSATVMMAMIVLRQNKLMENKRLNNILIAMSSLFLLFFLIRKTGSPLDTIMLKVLFPILLFSTLSLYFIKKKQFVLLGFFYAGVVSQVVMISSPAIPVRSTLFFIFMTFIVITAVFAEFILLFNSKYIKLALVSPIVLWSVLNASSILNGYHENYFPQSVNIEVLNRTREMEKSGIKVQDVVLLKQIDYVYGSTMPYVSDSIINQWMKDYYHINNETFTWKSIYDLLDNAPIQSEK